MLRNSCYLRMSSPVLAQKDQFPWLLIMSSPVISSDKKITVPSWPGSPHLNRKLDHLKVTRLPSVHPTYLAGKSPIYREYSHSYLYLWGNFHCNVWLPESVYIYIPEGPGVLRWRSGGVGWGGVGHVTVMFMLRWCYVDGRGGVGWGMLPSCSCYVDATLMGGVGWGMLQSCSCYVDATLLGGVGWGMLPSCSCYVDATLLGGVGWGMLPSCSCYVDATLMGGVGWGGACYRHVHVTLMLRWWVGWGGACYRHVHVTLMLRWWEGWGGSRCSAVSIGSLQKHRCFWPSGSIAGLPRSSVGKVKRTFHRFTVSPLLRACCWLNIQCSQCAI